MVSRPLSRVIPQIFEFQTFRNNILAADICISSLPYEVRQAFELRHPAADCRVSLCPRRAHAGWDIRAARRHGNLGPEPAFSGRAGGI